jgi:membrane fusion protein (multidrug efflux system)
MEEQKPKNKSKKIFPIILVIVLLAGGFYAWREYSYGLHHEDTDDAQIEGNISPVSARVSGYVTEVYVDDYQRVTKDQVLVNLYERDLLV